MSTACPYPTDISDTQWEALDLLLPKPQWRSEGPGRKPLGRPRLYQPTLPVKDLAEVCARCRAFSVIRVKYGAMRAHSSSLISLGYALRSILLMSHHYGTKCITRSRREGLNGFNRYLCLLPHTA